MRYVVSVVVGLLVAFGLFLLMNKMISGNPPVNAGNESTAHFVDFIRVQRNEHTETKNRQTPEKPKKEQPPSQPQLQQAEVQSPNVHAPDIQMPDMVAPIGAAGGAGPFLGGYRGPGANEGDVIPLVQIEPQYPREAAINSIEGYVKLEFTIEPDGTVSNPHVVESKPGRVFDSAAMRAILKWKFKPRIVDGKAVARQAVQVIDFKLHKDQGQ